MKTILAAISLATCAGLAVAADGYRTTAGESDIDGVVKVQVGAADNTYYNNQAGQQDLHQPEAA